MLQQGALIAELGDQLQTGAGANTQDPDHIDVVQASHCCHVLHGTLKLKSQSNDSEKHKLQSFSIKYNVISITVTSVGIIIGFSSDNENRITQYLGFRPDNVT